MQPLDRKLVPPPATPGQAAGAGLKARQVHERPGVLVVDDDHFVRSILQLGLERNGFDVWPAANGREAVALCRKHRERIAVVLLDARMPGLDGPGALDALRELHPDLLVCFMSGETGAYDPHELLRRGAAGIIVKPFHISQLADTLRVLAERVPGGPRAPAGV